MDIITKMDRKLRKCEKLLAGCLLCTPDCFNEIISNIELPMNSIMVRAKTLVRDSSTVLIL